MVEIPGVQKNKLLETFVAALVVKPMDKDDQEKAERGIKSVASTLDQLAEQAKQTAEQADRKVKDIALSLTQLYYQSRKIGESARAIDALGYAAQQAGYDAGKAQQQLIQFFEQVERQPGLLKAMERELTAYGYRAEGGLADKMQSALEALDKMRRDPRTTTKAVGIMKAWGLDEDFARAAARPEFKEALQEQLKRNKGLEEAAKAAAEFERALNNLTAALTAVGRELAAQVFGDYTDAINELARWVDANHEHIVAIVRQTLEAFRQSFNDLRVKEIFGALLSGFQEILDTINNITGTTDGLRFFLDAFTATLLGGELVQFVFWLNKLSKGAVWTFILWLARGVGFAGAAALAGATLFPTPLYEPDERERQRRFGGGGGMTGARRALREGGGGGDSRGRGAGSRSFRHNNPGNLKYAEWEKQFGAVPGEPAPDGGFYARFPDEASGHRALYEWWNRHPDKTIGELLPTYSGGGYRSLPGVPSGAKWSQLNDEQKNTVLSAIKRAEGWYGPATAPSAPSASGGPAEIPKGVAVPHPGAPSLTGHLTAEQAGIQPKFPVDPRVNWKQIDAELIARMNAAYGAMPASERAGFKMISGYRPTTRAEARRLGMSESSSQEDIWQRSRGGTLFAAARPGRSQHQRGTAADFSKTDWLRAHEQEFGLEHLHTVIDRPHIQLHREDVRSFLREEQAREKKAPPVQNPLRHTSTLMFDPNALRGSALGHGATKVAYTGSRASKATIEIHTTDPVLAAREAARYARQINNELLQQPG